LHGFFPTGVCAGYETLLLAFLNKQKLIPSEQQHQSKIRTDTLQYCAVVLSQVRFLPAVAALLMPLLGI